MVRRFGGWALRVSILAVAVINAVLFWPVWLTLEPFSFRAPAWLVFVAMAVLLSIAATSLRRAYHRDVFLPLRRREHDRHLIIGA